MPYYAAFVKQKLLRERTMASPGKKRVCHGAAGAVYCPCMSEQQEDMSAFNSWDCFGATLMLGVTPGIICYATTDPHDVTRAAWLCVLGVIIALVVLAVIAFFANRIIGPGANYLYMAKPEAAPSVLDILPPNFLLRTTIMVAVVTALFFVAYLPWLIKDRKAKKAVVSA